MQVTFESNLAENYKFKLPELRVGTLDSLMVLSDDLVKTNTLVEAVVNKLRRQLFDLQSSGEPAALSASRAAISCSGAYCELKLLRPACSSATSPSCSKQHVSQAVMHMQAHLTTP